MKKTSLTAGLVFAMLNACTPSQQKTVLTQSGLNPENFETIVGTRQVRLYTLKNKTGMEVCITNFGGRIVSIWVPDKNGEMKDVVLGFDHIKDYQTIPSDFGAIIGRYANRIAFGKITVDGRTFQLPTNNYGHTLHGGPDGWQYRVYEATQTDDHTLKLTMTSPDGDMNFPGNVSVSVTYQLTEDNAIDIRYEATSDKKTVINMTNHSYFNLNANPAEATMNNILYVAADSITPVDSTFMTTGEMMAVAGTPFDFRTPAPLTDRVTAFDHEQIRFGHGIDHNFVLNTKGDDSRIAARLVSPVTGISLEVYTDEPGIQVYTGNFLDDTVTGKDGITYPQRAAVCLETQHYPDTPNKPQWPSAYLEPGKTYHSHCIFKFGVVQ
ncbi:aldose epimerase family protein [Phocaeicola abscessus]|uniref:aldose epimerase family protein n=1 Tax=Phocaeicola abscessus TaxID=555313 RepID=UPI0004B53CEC|nr:aldose epimerase family protein [Phocaeicola abscessus]